MADEDKKSSETAEPERRHFLGVASTAAMAAGLAGGYGAFALVSGRYLYPAHPVERGWQFVAEADKVVLDKTILYRSPAGETINITRKGRAGSADDFIALSSTCPHLGCQVHWESQNNRYFCPCHNGVFDPEGVGTEGPPGDAGQSLPRYRLKVEEGLLYIEVELDRLSQEPGEILDGEAGHAAPGHDPCLEPDGRKRFA